LYLPLGTPVVPLSSSATGCPMRTITEIQQTLPSSVENGLTPEGVGLSRQRFGVNRLTPLPREPIWKKFLEKFDEPIIKILRRPAVGGRRPVPRLLHSGRRGAGAGCSGPDHRLCATAHPVDSVTAVRLCPRHLLYWPVRGTWP